jgi:hypothetical protein
LPVNDKLQQRNIPSALLGCIHFFVDFIFLFFFNR